MVPSKPAMNMLRARAAKMRPKTTEETTVKPTSAVAFVSIVASIVATASASAPGLLTASSAIVLATSTDVVGAALTTVLVDALPMEIDGDASAATAGATGATATAGALGTSAGVISGERSAILVRLARLQQSKRRIGAPGKLKKPEGIAQTSLAFRARNTLRCSTKINCKFAR